MGNDLVRSKSLTLRLLKLLTIGIIITCYTCSRGVHAMHGAPTAFNKNLAFNSTS